SICWRKKQIMGDLIYVGPDAEDLVRLDARVQHPEIRFVVNRLSHRRTAASRTSCNVHGAKDSCDWTRTCARGIDKSLVNDTNIVAQHHGHGRCSFLGLRSWSAVQWVRHRRRRADRAPGRCRAGGGLLGGKDPTGRFLIRDGRTRYPSYNKRTSRPARRPSPPPARSLLGILLLGASPD